MGTFSIPLIDFLVAFDLPSVLLACGIPLVLGIVAGYFCKPKIGIILACISGFVAVILTVLYQFGRQVHHFDYLGFLVGPPVSSLFIGIVVGVLLCYFKNRNRG